jgi:antitoxin (DNA-binding transcriptional repressor) of toxin-antitoxin stability system
MITGLREFRKNLSKYAPIIGAGKVVIITHRNAPIAAYLSPEKLEELAREAKDKLILAQINEAKTGKNKEFLDNKKALVDYLNHYVQEAVRGKGRVPDQVTIKLQTILSSAVNLISDEGSIEDQRFLNILHEFSHDPISRVLDYDYYYVHNEFIEKVKEEIRCIIEEKNQDNSDSKKSQDLKLLIDLVENSVIRKKTAKDNSVDYACSVLVKMTTDNKYITSRIYTIMPYWYEKPSKFNYYLRQSDPIAVKMKGMKVGQSFSYQKYTYEIVAIT